MTRIEAYRDALDATSDWDAYLKRHSGLPGPRGNIELAQAVAGIGDAALFRRYAALGSDKAPQNTPGEFLAFCGVLGLGELAARGNAPALASLRKHAADPRWRIREAVAMGLQRVGDRDMGALLRVVRQWASGNHLDKRAAAAALAEPRLLHEPRHRKAALGILDRITRSMEKTPAPQRESSFRVLRQGLAYAWSVLVAADFGEGKPFMEKWMGSQDPDILWIMQQNLKKARLARADRAWVTRWSENLAWRRRKGARNKG
ncbi:MAG: hypothetical protein ACRDG5_04080, partial [Anaerolineales bacterium]